MNNFIKYFLKATKILFNFRQKIGLTVIELVVSIGVLVLLGAVAAPIYGNLQVQSQLNGTGDLLIQYLRTAQQNAQARYHDSIYGVKFFEHSFVLYQGNSYNTRNQNYDREENLDHSLTLSTDLVNNDLHFSKGLGEANQTGAIFLKHSAQDNSKGFYIIEVNDRGLIERVDDYNYPPVAQNDTYNNIVNESIKENVLKNDSDVDNDELQAIYTGAIPDELKYGELLGFDANGVFLYKSNGIEGTDKFVYRAYDGEKYSEYATVYIINKKKNHAPLAKDDYYKTPSNEELKENVLKNDKDEDGDKLYIEHEYKLPMELKYGTLVEFNKDGIFLYEPNGKEGKDKFAYRAYDGEEYSEYATVYITTTATLFKP